MARSSNYDADRHRIRRWLRAARAEAAAADASGSLERGDRRGRKPVHRNGASAILSPDGTRLALVATGADQKRRIYVRSLDQLQATALSGTENARDPFFSPDGQWIGFFR